MELMDKQKIEYVWSDKGEGKRIYQFLIETDNCFIPKLSERVNIEEYAQKLAQNAENIFVSYEGQDIGACSVYCNSDIAFISSFAVKPEYMRMKIGSHMMGQVVQQTKQLKCKSIRLEVYASNSAARTFYEKCGFVSIAQKDEWITMDYVY